MSNDEIAIIKAQEAHEKRIAGVQVLQDTLKAHEEERGLCPNLSRQFIEKYGEKLRRGEV